MKNYIIEVKGVLKTSLEKKSKKYKVYIEDLKDEKDISKLLENHFTTFNIICTYQQLYKVIIIRRKTGNRKTYRKDLTREEAQRIVKSFPSYENKMYCFDRQFIKTDFTIYSL